MNATIEKTVKMIPISPDGIDDIFTLKHDIEKKIAEEDNKDIVHMELNDFLTNYLKFGKNSFTDTLSKETIAFSLYESDSVIFCLYSDVVNDRTLIKFKDYMDEIHWDISNLKYQNTADVWDSNIDSRDLFVIGDRMCWL